MLNFILENWQIIFGGIGTAAVAAGLGWLLRKRAKEAAQKINQHASSGTGSQIIQAGRDVSVGGFQANKEGPK